VKSEPIDRSQEFDQSDQIVIDLTMDDSGDDDAPKTSSFSPKTLKKPTQNQNFPPMLFLNLYLKKKFLVCD